MIEVTEPAEASLEARIAELVRMYQERQKSRQQALQQAQRDAEELLRCEGAINELTRWKNEIWGDRQGDSNAGE